MYFIWGYYVSLFCRIFTPIWIPSKKIINMDGVHAVDRFSYEWPWLVGILALVLLVLLIVSCYFCWRSHECSGEMHYIDSTKPRSHSYYDCPIHGPVLIGGKTKLGDKDIVRSFKIVPIIGCVSFCRFSNAFRAFSLMECFFGKCAY